MPLDTENTLFIENKLLPYYLFYNYLYKFEVIQISKISSEAHI